MKVVPWTMMTRMLGGPRERNRKVVRTMKPTAFSVQKDKECFFKVYESNEFHFNLICTCTRVRFPSDVPIKGIYLLVEALYS